jgi:hypothetical protein
VQSNRSLPDEAYLYALNIDEQVGWNDRHFHRAVMEERLNYYKC